MKLFLSESMILCWARASE